uniref:BRCT domain-containing protein n=1 Tax=Strongyloides papillosus TaxID=174720 RepID=A0A0N5C8E7_STREA
MGKQQLKTTLHPCKSPSVWSTLSNDRSQDTAKKVHSQVQQNPFFVIKRLALTKDAFKGEVPLVTGGRTNVCKAMVSTISTLGGNVAIPSRKIKILNDGIRID